MAHAQPLAGSHVDSEIGNTTREPVSCCTRACAAQRSFSWPPAWRPPRRRRSPPEAGRPAHIRDRHPLRGPRLLRTRHPPLALPPRTSPRRVRRRRHRAQPRPGSPPHRGRRHPRTAPRRRKSRGLPAAPHPPPAQEPAQDMGRRSERSSLRRRRNGREIEAEAILPSPRCASVLVVSLRTRHSRRAHSRRQQLLVARRAKGAQPSPARLYNRPT